MAEFFHGWKRQVGCVTLVIACAFVAGWVRSLCISDLFVVYHNLDARTLGSDTIPVTVFIHSSQGELAWERDEGALDQVFVDRWTMIVGRGNRWVTREVPPAFTESHLRKRFLNPGFALWRNERLDTKPISLVALPYWSVVIPLTAVSCWLLMSKPRANASSQPAFRIGWHW